MYNKIRNICAINSLYFLFLIGCVLCKNCSEIQQTTMILPENGFNIFTDYIQGRKSISKDIKLYHPIIWATAKFPNGVIVYSGVLKSSNSNNYNFKFLFIADKRRKYTNHNNRKPIFQAMDVTEDTGFREKMYKFTLDYDECKYYLKFKEQKYKKHFRLLILIYIYFI